MSIYKNSFGSKHYVEALGSTTLNGSAQVLKTINTQTFGQILSTILVISGATITGAAILKLSGSTATSGGTLTTILSVTIPISGTTAVLQVDAEDIVTACEAAGLTPNGFLSLQWIITGTNTDTIKSAVVVCPMHERVGLTPSSITALT